jgi:DNA-binding MarR family transcriptional regulator
LEVSDSVLSKHLSALGEADYVRLRKAAQDGRQRTWASLTRPGRKAFAAHMAALQALVASAQAAVAAE